MTLFETKVIKVSDFNSCHTYTENTDSKELSVVNVCFKMILFLRTGNSMNCCNIFHSSSESCALSVHYVCNVQNAIFTSPKYYMYYLYIHS